MNELKYELTVIRPDQIAPLDRPEFNRFSEEQYRNFLAAAQPWILSYTPGTPPAQAMLDGAELPYVFASIQNAVSVKRTPNGLYQMDYNGRHRLYVARKYGFALLVLERVSD